MIKVVTKDTPWIGMREIKFRAWDKKNNTMVSPVAVYESGDHVGFGLDTWNKCYGKDFQPDLGNEPDASDDDWFYLLGGFELMQFTGLKDRKGVEIYEGDVVKVKISDKHEQFTIVWQEDRMRFGLKELNSNFLGDSWAFTCNNKIEVIGNIYEHPELLTK